MLLALKRGGEYTYGMGDGLFGILAKGIWDTDEGALL